MNIRRAFATAAAGALVLVGATACGSEDPDSAATTTWFTTFCEGVAPLQDSATLGAKLGDPATAGPALSEMGQSFLDTADKLSGLAAPDINEGEKVASSVVAGFKQIGEAFTTAGTQFATDPGTASNTLASAMTNNPMQELEDISASQETMDAVKAIPACQNVGF